MIVSLTIVRYRKAFIPLALLAMALHRLPLMLQKGCIFWKLMGCGRNGSFDLTPDWQQWCLLATWNSRADFDAFYQRSFIAGWWKKLATDSWTLLAEPLQSHGTWDGTAPFGKPDVKSYAGPVAVLTRATINFKRLKNFWSHVDAAARVMASSEGYITSVGIGEAPVFRQATFSVWESLDHVKAFAYKGGEHADIIKKTRSENWYSEELFARFKPVAAWGTLNGTDPLQDKIKF
jgi:hypothetical protein